MSNLKTTLEKLAADFAAAAVAAIQHASLGDIAGLARSKSAAPAPRAAKAPRGARRGRRRRRTTADIGKVVSAIAQLLATHKGGLRAEQIRTELGLPRKELPRPLAEGLKAGKFRKRGQKRATVYFVGTGPSAGAKAKPPKKHAVKRQPKKAAPKKTVAKRAAKRRVARMRRLPKKAVKHAAEGTTNAATATATTTAAAPASATPA